MSPSLDQATLGALQETLNHGRQGRATLPQLIEAHELACKAGLNGVVGELRAHIRAMVPAPTMHSEAKSIFLGVLSGIATHLLLKRFDRHVEP
jgi:hypothetical protein